MALRPDRDVLYSDAYSYTLSDVAAPGVGLCLGTAGSGAVLGDTHGIVNLKANPSGFKFAGILLQNFVNIDQTLYNKNWYKEEMVIGDVPDIMTKGWVWTDKLKAGDTPTVGDPAYLTANGEFTTTSLGSIATPLAGQFMGKKDESAFVKIAIDLPMIG